jgi:hypothetical protein
MPPIEFEQFRNSLGTARQEREAAESRLRANTRRLAAAEAEREALARGGAQGEALNAKAAQIEALRQERKDILAERVKLDGVIVDRLGEAVGTLPPQDFIAGLDAGVPLAMLPVRLETRFFDDGRELRIRIFPDQIHLDTHNPELTQREADLGRWYWMRRLAGDASAWTELVRALDPGRALWVARSLTPGNYDAVADALPAGAEPAFPEVALRPGDIARAPRAVALPDRWVAVGLKRRGVAAFTTLFTRWSSVVPDSLNVGPAFEGMTELVQSLDEPPVDAELRWLTDFAAAQQAGMAITVRDGDLSQGRLADGIDLLLVFGVDWTLSPEQAAARLEQLLQAHQYSDGLAFVPQGTPTNNTGDRRSGFSSAPAEAAAGVDPIRPPTVDPEHGAGPRLIRALGLEGELGRVAGGGMTEQRTVSLLIDTLWQSTLGYYLDKLIDPFATDTLIGRARDHATAHLQPFGPFSALRIGRQPYGVLPAIALEAFKPDRDGGTEAGLKRLLQVLRWYWRDGVDDVPRMGRRDDPDDDLLELLQQSAVSANLAYRQVLDTETAAGNTRGLERLMAVQSEILRSLVLPNLASFTGPMFHAARILQLALYPNERPFQAPWVQPGPLQPGAALSRNYIAEIAAAARAGSAGTADLNARTRSTHALLEILLAHAAQWELTAAQSLLAHRFFQQAGVLTQTVLKANINVGSTLGVYAQPEESAAGKLFIQTPKQLAATVVPELTGTASLADYVASQLRLPLGPERPELHTLAQFLRNLDALSAVPAAEIDRSLRGVLDCYAYRYDAWVTSLASRRLDAMRGRRAAGINLGGYGWVHDLRPDSQPDSLGYVHAPSLNHAVTAAVLRSGHLSHRGNESEALNIDLSSRRVRLALNLIEGVAQGQPLAALLGYRFERQLRDRNIELARFILPFRKLAPLRSADGIDEGAPSEAIAARDVVDGVALVSRWKQGEEDLIGLLARHTRAATDGERSQINGVLSDLNDALDAVSDLLTSEAVFQTVQGNYERAGAALAALDRQGRPPDPQVVRTPRSGMTYTQRVVLVLQETTLPEGWGEADLRARVEPRLNAWIARMLGDPRRILLAAELRRGGEAIASLSLPLPELGLSPLSLALLCCSTHASQPSDLEVRLAARFAAKVTDPAEDLELALLDAPPDGSDDDAVGLGPLLAQLRLINAFIAKRRPLDARDLFPPEGEAAPGFLLDELRNRLVNLAFPALTSARVALSKALAAPTPTGLRDALLATADLGCADAFPDTLLADEDALASLTEQAQSVHETLQRTETQLQERMAGFAMPEAGDPTGPVRAAEHYLACLRLVLGEAFPVLPLFNPANAPELRASGAEQAALLDGDAFAPVSFLQQMARVRPDVDALSAILTAADLLGNGVASDDWSVMQLPHVAGQRWAALPGSDANPLLCLLTLGRHDLSAPLAGLSCDGWSETIPAAKEMTGISFHYDAPAARAPQTVLLMVPPDLAQARWSYDTLVATLLETWELMQLRAVGPKQIRALGGGMLPALYLPQDNTFQVPSVGLGPLAERYKSSVLGKFRDEQ